MPTYEFKNTTTGEIFEEIMSYSSKVEYLKENPNIHSHFSSFPPMTRGTEKWDPSNNQDSGWNENMARIAEAHPNSSLAEKVGGRNSKQSKIAEIARKRSKFKKDYNMNFDVENDNV